MTSSSDNPSEEQRDKHAHLAMDSALKEGLKGGCIATVIGYAATHVLTAKCRYINTL